MSTTPSCPQMMRLGRNLVDAYRRYDSIHAIKAKMDLDQVHNQMMSHRRTCEICQEMAKKQTDPSDA
jgi:hypothetical protein